MSMIGRSVKTTAGGSQRWFSIMSRRRVVHPLLFKEKEDKQERHKQQRPMHKPRSGGASAGGEGDRGSKGYARLTDGVTVEERVRRHRARGQGPKVPVEKLLPWNERPAVAVPTRARACSIAVIGKPNVGKSQLINAMVKAPVTAVSPKQHTTRERYLGVLTEGDTQLVFLDTPGVIGEKNVKAFNRSLATGAWLAALDSDVIVVMMDAHRGIDQTDREMMVRLGGLRERRRELIEEAAAALAAGGTSKKEISHTKEGEEQEEHFSINEMKSSGAWDEIADEDLSFEIPSDEEGEEGEEGVEDATGEGDNADYLRIQSILKERDGRPLRMPKFVLALNKVDRNKARTMAGLDHMVNQVESYGIDFDEIVHISARHGAGMPVLKEKLMALAPTGQWEYESSMVSPDPVLKRVQELIREKIYRRCNAELPYHVTQRNREWKEHADGTLDISQTLYVAKSSHQSILKYLTGTIARKTESELCRMLDRVVRVHLTVKLRPNGIPEDEI